MSTASDSTPSTPSSMTRSTTSWVRSPPPSTRAAGSSSRRTIATPRFSPPPQRDGGTGLDGLWADDFHHEVRVALTGEQESYLKDFTGSAEDLAETLANGWFYRGQESRNHGKARGTPCDPAATARVLLLHLQPRPGG